ncbi:MAG: Stp1/IreP family PP2C-type Ser/Thr phosphatase [Polyangiaceae bacterium]|nr:Stp1/IreP family PP2C-type Ser/Thr phosphatase [Polyangiaceae bacterium]
MRANAAGLTDVGLQRDHNEDSFVIAPEFNLYIVADGMGGHRAGDVASKMATEAITEFFRSTSREDATWPFHFDTNLSEEENRLVAGIRLANRQIFDKGVRSRDHSGMGTTVVGALFSKRKNRIFVGHVGDSRAYRVRKGTIVQLTRDHSLLNDYLAAMPDLTEEQQAEVPRNVITRALGMQDTVSVDLVSDDPQAGDAYLLCSDGLSGMLADQDILDIMSATRDPAEICQKLVDEANDQGGEDNITALVVLFDDHSEEDADTVAGGAPETKPAGTMPTEAPPPAAPEKDAGEPTTLDDKPAGEPTKK